ncbi:DUF4268 domain-containing protein [Rhodococcus opacus]|uniref:DUF4268 domain-containing protein n=1 Tax=Rhodococcus opacus TaxID=37919 RepID=UPI00217EEC09|nr:DUF4268 domain-containing protein [Rhodococcus opacus]
MFHEVLTAANTRQPAISVPKPQKGNWISFAGSPFGTWGMSISDDLMRVEAYIDTYNADINNALFDEFAADAVSWQAHAGLDLVWERLDDRRASRIAAYRSSISTILPIATRPANGQSTRWSPCTTP